MDLRAAKHAFRVVPLLPPRLRDAGGAVGSGGDEAEYGDWSLCVNRATYDLGSALDPVVRLRESLSDPSEPYRKVFLAGHVGTGKSTEINRIAADMMDDHEVVRVPVLEYVNEADFHYAHLFLLLLVEILKRIDHYRGFDALTGDEGYRAADLVLRRQLAGVAGAPVQLDEVEIGVRATVELVGKLRIRSDVRKAIRALVPEQQDALVSAIDAAVRVLHTLVDRPTLLFVDGLDRIAPDSGTGEVFGAALPALYVLQTRMLLTVPLAVHYDRRFGDYHRCTHKHVLTNVKVFRGRGDYRPHPPGVVFLTDFVHKRLHGRADAEPAAIRRAIQISGGNLRELCRVMFHACEHAILRGLDWVNSEAVQRAESLMQEDLARLLLARARKRLERIAHEHTLDEEDFDLLPVLAVMEIPDGPPWYDVHPLARGLIDAEPLAPWPD